MEMDIALQNPFITKANASILARKRWDAYRDQLNKPKPVVAPESIPTPHAIIMQQIQDLDEAWKDADTAERLKIADAKQKLWLLVNAKPRATKRNERPVIAQPIPQQVVSCGVQEQSSDNITSPVTPDSSPKPQ